jgi:hypothetical protein
MVGGENCERIRSRVKDQVAYWKDQGAWGRIREHGWRFRSIVGGQGP